MPIFIQKKFSPEFLPTFKVAEFEFEFEPGDLGAKGTIAAKWKKIEKEDA